MEPLRELLEEISSNFEHIGLYLVDANVATSDPNLADGEEFDLRDKLVSGESDWIVQTVFNIGDVAWTDRVLNPEEFQMVSDFAEDMPTEIEAYKTMLAEAGGDPFRLAEMMGEVDNEDDLDD